MIANTPLRRVDVLVKRLALYLSSGMLVGAVALHIQGCGGPPLQPWLTEALTAEFTAEGSTLLKHPKHDPAQVASQRANGLVVAQCLCALFLVVAL